VLTTVTDREALRAWLMRDPEVHLYELGDLDDFFWPHTRWYALGDAIALVYDAPPLPALLAFGEPVQFAPLLAELRDVLPRELYAHLSPGLYASLAPRFASVSPSVAGSPPVTAFTSAWPGSSRCSRAAAPAVPGAPHATVHARVTVVTLPAASLARTASWCGPAARLMATGLAQVKKPAPSRLHATAPPLVVKGDVEGSGLNIVLTRVIKRMPYDAPLPDKDIELIQRWIMLDAPGLDP
jgi:hypothetical protein